MGKGVSFDSLRKSRSFWVFHKQLFLDVICVSLVFNWTKLRFAVATLDCVADSKVMWRETMDLRKEGKASEGNLKEKDGRQKVME